MSLKYFFSGFLIRGITGFDDIMVHIPVVANIAKTKLGRVAFSIGVLMAITIALIFSFLFASFIKLIPYHKYIVAGLLVLIAFSIYFELFTQKPKKHIEKKIKKIKKITPIRFFKFLFLGFVMAFATLIDDAIVYSSLFFSEPNFAFYAILGIFAMTFIELIVIIYFSEKMSKLKYKKEFTFVGLLVLASLILAGFL